MRNFTAFVAILSLSLAASPAWAVNDFWDGGGANNDITTGGNWVDNSAPASGFTTDLFFSGTVRTSPNFPSAFSLNSLTINNTAAFNPFSFTGASLTIGEGGIFNHDNDIHNFELPVTFLGNQTSIFAGNGALHFPLPVALATNQLTIDGPASVYLPGGTTGPGAITKNGIGVLTIHGSTGTDFNINAGAFATQDYGSPVTFTSTSSIAINNAAVFHINDNMTLDGAQLTRDSGATVYFSPSRTLTIQNGGDFITTGTFDTSFNSTLTINVNGAGSTLQTTVGGGLYFDGTINAQNGGDVIVSGQLWSTSGDLNIDGPGSSITVAGSSQWGASLGGPAVMTLSNSAAASFAGLIVGRGHAQAYSQVLTGADVANQGDLVVGGELCCLSGGVVTVDGAGSTWTQSSGSLVTIGTAPSTSGEVYVKNGGTFNTGTGLTTVASTGTLDVQGGTMSVGGALTNEGYALLTSGTITVQGALANRNILRLDTGTLNVHGLFSNSGQFDFIAGALNLLGPNNLTVGSGGLLGSNLTLLANRAVQVAGTTTIDASRTLTLDGGTLRTGVLVKNGTLDFRKGTLGITGLQGLEVGASGPLGASVTLGDAMRLEVTRALTVGSGGSIAVNGGSLSVGQNLDNQGTIRATAGTISASGGVNVSGGRIFVRDTFSFTGNFTNSAGARVTLEGASGLISGPGIMANSGLLTGDGTVAMQLENNGGGEVRAESGKTLYFTHNAGANNSGEFNLLGGTLDFRGPLVNAAAGFIAGRGALLTGNLTNNGVLAFSSGNTDIFGDVTNAPAARIVTSGGATTTFYDDVAHNGAEIRTSAGGRSVFFGALSGAGPFTGTGTAHVEGDLRPGNSPALVTFGGDLVFGSFATLEVEIAGTTPGNQFDQIAAAGSAYLDGTLNVQSIGNFAPMLPGQSFTVMTFGSHTGEFESVVGIPNKDLGGLFWTISYTPNTAVITSSAIPGDIDLDGDVERRDAALFAQFFGTNSGANWTTGDFNADGATTLADLGILQAHLGQAVPSPAASAAPAAPVPEPGTLSIACGALVSIVALRVRKVSTGRRARA